MLRVVLVTMMFAGAADADEHPVEIATTACLEQPANASTHGQVQCLNAAEQDWDRALNRVWGDLLDLAPAEAHAAMRKAQRSWLAFRDAEFAAIDSTYGAMDGTMYRLFAASARARIVADRVRQLESLRSAYAPE
jgi:uncharacterized protein YecT (DUF1311 family)